MWRTVTEWQIKKETDRTDVDQDSSATDFSAFSKGFARKGGASGLGNVVNQSSARWRLQLKPPLDGDWVSCYLFQVERTWSIELIGLVGREEKEETAAGECWQSKGKKQRKKNPKKDPKAFSVISSKGEDMEPPPMSLRLCVLTFVLSKTNDAINFPIVGTVVVLGISFFLSLISKYFQHRFVSNLKGNQRLQEKIGFRFLYLAPGKYMDPSMKTEPHSRTYQQEHNSPRLQTKSEKRIRELDL